MPRLLTIGEVANRLRLEVDTVRRLERRGDLAAVRTDGGHRRFREDVVAQFAARRDAERRKPRAKTIVVPPLPVKHAPPAKRKAPIVPAVRAYRTPDEFDDESLITDWADARARIGDEIPDPEPPAIRPAGPVAATLRISRTPDTASMIARTAIAADERARDEARRLQTIKTAGLVWMSSDIPPTWRAKVIADLEQFVQPTQFPAYLSLHEAVTIVRARMDEVVQPWRDDVARRDAIEAASKAAADAAERRVAALQDHARVYARQQTEALVFVERIDAQHAAGAAIAAEEIDATWSESDVEAVVDDVLDDLIKGWNKRDKRAEREARDAERED